MYVLEHALKKKRLGRLFAYLLLIASFGIGCSTQAGTVTETVSSLTGAPAILTGGLLVFFVGYVILHGSSSIKKLCLLGTKKHLSLLSSRLLLSVLELHQFNADALADCTAGRESHPALKITDRIPCQRRLVKTGKM